MKKHLFYTFLTIFAATAIITLAGITKLISIDDFYLKGLFSCLIIELIGTIIGLYKNTNFFPNEDTEKLTPTCAVVAQPAIDTKPNESFNISNITVFEIVESLNSIPPFQRKETSQKYNGIFVDWNGFLCSAEADWPDKEMIGVHLRTPGESIIGYNIFFSIKPDFLPEIKILPKDSHIRVIGEILRASGEGLSVTIRPVQIKVLSTAPVDAQPQNA